MTSRTSRFPAVAQRRQPTQAGSWPASVIVGSLFAAAVFFQPPAHSAPPNAGAKSEATVARSSDSAPDSAARIAELEKGFWVCDYVGTTRGVDGPYAVNCGTNFEELKQAKFGGDFDALVDWWRVNKAVQHNALESAVSAQF